MSPATSVFRGDEGGDRSPGRVAEEHRPTHLERRDKLADVRHVALEVVSRRRLVAKAVAAEIHADEAVCRREPFGQGSEAVRHPGGAVEAEDRRLAAGPVHHMQRHLPQRDKILARQRRPW
jgi:hypothetical protein